jgi:hypothetical protein
MTVTKTAVVAGAYSKSWNITSDADGDTTFTFAHGFVVQDGVAKQPTLVWLAPLQSTQFYAKKWALGTVDATNITINAASAAGGGLAGTPQLQVIATLPHSIVD